jgi:hypothetical protein
MAIAKTNQSKYLQDLVDKLEQLRRNDTGRIYTPAGPGGGNVRNKTVADQACLPIIEELGH